MKAFALGCDCEVRVYPPTTASHQMAPTTLKEYQLEEFSTYSAKNQVLCKKSCERAFQEDMPSKRLNALLITHGQKLIREGALGFNCTGLTTIKYPVRVKASLGELGLGNVADTVQVVTHEEECF